MSVSVQEGTPCACLCRGHDGRQRNGTRPFAEGRRFQLPPGLHGCRGVSGASRSMMGCRAAAPLWDMDAIMAKYCMVLMVLVVTCTIFLPEVSADIGKHPTMTLHIQKNGERAAGVALMCHDAFMTRRFGYQAIK